eukprot:2304276-Prymnesium_polylepis.1
MRRSSVLPKPCVAPRSVVSGAGDGRGAHGDEIDVHLVLEAQIAAAVAHLHLREIDHAALVVDRVELR